MSKSLILAGLSIGLLGSCLLVFCWGFPKYKTPHWEKAWSPRMQIAGFALLSIGFILQIVGYL